MKKKRVIPVLLLKNGFLVQSKGFNRYQNLGNPVTAVKRLSEWAADELVYLDISRDDNYDMRRNDLGHANRKSFMEIVADVSLNTRMPITVGGKIRSLDDINIRLTNGADKVVINTKALEDQAFIRRAAEIHGSQCVMVSMDVKTIEGRKKVMSEGGRTMTDYDPLQWAKIVEGEGAGELLVNSIDRDGARTGYDLELLSQLADSVRIPVIALGGVGEWSHFETALTQTKVDAVAAANIFHYYDQSVYLAKKHLFSRGCNVRRPDLIFIDEGEKHEIL